MSRDSPYFSIQAPTSTHKISRWQQNIISHRDIRSSWWYLGLREDFPCVKASGKMCNSLKTFIQFTYRVLSASACVSRDTKLLFILVLSVIITWIILRQDYFTINVPLTTVPAAKNTNIKRINARLFLANNTRHRNRSSVTMSHLPKDCRRPVTKIVYIKIEKTGSGIITSILDRYGISRNLTFAVPDRKTYISRHPFERHVYRYRDMIGYGGFDMFTNHGTYNRMELDRIISNARYITSIRHPVSHFESIFAHHSDRIILTDTPKHESNPLAAFFKSTHSGLLDNYQLRYLGETKMPSNASLFQDLFDRLDNEFSLVTINEYFVESLVLLKNMLCWTLDDILFLPRHVRVDSRRISQSQVESVRQHIEAYNYADMELYRYYNASLWKKIANQPDQGQFWRDVQELRRTLSHLEDVCIMDKAPGARYQEYVSPEDEETKKYCEKYLRHLMTDNIPMKIYTIDHLLNT